MAKKIVPFYNIEQNVGKGCVNASDDVLLVQYFLSEIAKGSSLPLTPPSVKLKLNGVFSDELELYIIWFQGCVKKVGKVTEIDGKLMPANNQNPYGTYHTMAHLNVAYRNRYKTAHNVLEDAPGLPQALSAKFKNAQLKQH